MRKGKGRKEMIVAIGFLLHEVEDVGEFVVE